MSPNSRRRTLAAAVLTVLPAVAGCLNIRSPDNFSMTAPEIRVGTAANETPKSMPDTHSHEEAKAELRKAYTRIESLERDNRKLKEKLDKSERELKTAERELKNAKKSQSRHEADDDAESHLTRSSESQYP